MCGRKASVVLAVRIKPYAFTLQTSLGYQQVTHSFVVDFKHAKFQLIFNHVPALMYALKQQSNSPTIYAGVLRAALLDGVRI